MQGTVGDPHGVARQMKGMVGKYQIVEEERSCRTGGGRSVASTTALLSEEIVSLQKTGDTPTEMGGDNRMMAV